MALRGFEVLAPLGHGQFGDVLLVRRTADGPLLAAKLVRGESAEAVAAARREAALLRALRHLNVVRCVDVVQSGAQLAIVMEYASGGDLDGYIRASKQQYGGHEGGPIRSSAADSDSAAAAASAKARPCAFSYRSRWRWTTYTSDESCTGAALCPLRTAMLDKLIISWLGRDLKPKVGAA